MYHFSKCDLFFKMIFNIINAIHYSPSSVIEFYEDVFIETTPDNKTEQKYSAIERISVVDNKVVYIHVNNIMSYILPFSCFESKEQYNEFFAQIAIAS